MFFPEAGGETGVQEVRNKQALLVYNRVQHKLTGASNFSIHVIFLTRNTSRSRLQHGHRAVGGGSGGQAYQAGDVVRKPLPVFRRMVRCSSEAFNYPSDLHF
jgi:hypothetical protein